MSFLYDNRGGRKYLTTEERNAFLHAAKMREQKVYTFCAVLAHTGARISEVLALTSGKIDSFEQTIIFESLKKRHRGVYRAVPIAATLLRDLIDFHSALELSCAPNQRLWPWCRTTAWKKVKEIMKAAAISGVHASPKGLRHGFAVSALQAGVPINLVQKWLGHSRLETTAIYANAGGEQERRIAERLWQTFYE